MRAFIAVLVIFFTWNETTAQEFKADISYQYLYSNQWDKAIQTYNFSRPFNIKKQPLLSQGAKASVSYHFKSLKNSKHGINLSYSYFKSSATNEYIKNTFNLHFLNVGYIFHYENTEKLKGFYTDLITSVAWSGLFRNVNGKPFEYDGTKSKSFGIGGAIGLKSGYRFKLKNKTYVSPFVGLENTPYFYSPNTEAVINQTKSLTSKNWTAILTAQIGLAFHLSPY